MGSSLEQTQIRCDPEVRRCLFHCGCGCITVQGDAPSKRDGNTRKDAVTIELVGELAAIMTLENKNPRDTKSGGQLMLVAGVGFEPTTFRL